MATSKHKSLTFDAVCALGSALIEVADVYPLSCRTERDFYPLVVAYLHGRVPSVKTEAATEEGSVDVRTGGYNPALLELAVAPRILSDRNHPNQKFPGHQSTTQLYACQNKTELSKLTGVPQSKAKNRYLLLIDLTGKHDLKKLQSGYESELPPGGGGAAVRVVYVRRGRNGTKDFRLGGKRKKK